MDFFNTTHAQFLLFSGYVLCLIVLNAIALLMSLFYRRKLKQTAPRWGFVIAIVLALLFGAVFLGSMKGSPLLQALARVSLTGSAIATIVSMAALFTTMVRVRK
ncbi:MAG: hypothetical protein MUF22_07715 [Chitinispirillaceae bacterium]|jgi:hypothetical protein|nr:hypothetical protein [Chitinispirillaceae bacterium]